VLVTRKLGAPRQPEFGVGAIAPGGMRIVDPQAVSFMGMTDEDLERVTRNERDEMRRRERLYRDDRPALDVKGRLVILVDDGIATGVTVRAAIMALRALGARRVILAVGVCSREAAAAIGPTVDDLVALVIPEELSAVGPYYDDFDQVTDDQVIDLLARSRVPPR
jgi:predicted phosphoribosyltransferase